ncbi:hypothetical protein YTPLAS73_14010 [Nitrosarchaeum sp.]|nr:hypothetical protein YTPLAS73_14010 [Nitrosarchaeum sp.]
MDNLTPKETEIYSDFKKIILELVDNLYKQNALKMNVTLEEDALTELVMKRVNLSAEVINLFDLRLKAENWDLFKTEMEKFEFTEPHILHAYVTLLCHQILDNYELFKKYLMIILDKKGLHLSGTEPLGIILRKLEQNKIENHLQECLNLELRNSIGHGWHWVKNNEFNYVSDPELRKTKSLTFGEFLIIVRQSYLLTYCFMNTAFDRILNLRDHGKH